MRKKVITIILAVALIAAMCVPVFPCDGHIPDRWKNGWGMLWIQEYTPE